MSLVTALNFLSVILGDDTLGELRRPASFQWRAVQFPDNDSLLPFSGYITLSPANATVASLVVDTTSNLQDWLLPMVTVFWLILEKFLSPGIWT